MGSALSSDGKSNPEYVPADESEEFLRDLVDFLRQPCSSDFVKFTVNTFRRRVPGNDKSSLGFQYSDDPASDFRGTHKSLGSFVWLLYLQETRVEHHGKTFSLWEFCVETIDKPVVLKLLDVFLIGTNVVLEDQEFRRSLCCGVNSSWDAFVRFLKLLGDCTVSLKNHVSLSEKVRKFISVEVVKFSGNHVFGRNECAEFNSSHAVSSSNEVANFGSSNGVANSNELANSTSSIEMPKSRTLRPTKVKRDQSWQELPSIIIDRLLPFKDPSSWSKNALDETDFPLVLETMEFLSQRLPLADNACKKALIEQSPDSSQDSTTHSVIPTMSMQINKVT